MMWRAAFLRGDGDDRCRRIACAAGWGWRAATGGTLIGTSILYPEISPNIKRQTQTSNSTWTRSRTQKRVVKKVAKARCMGSEQGSGTEARGVGAEKGSPLVGVQLTCTDGEYCRENPPSQVRAPNPEPCTLHPKP